MLAIHLYRYCDSRISPIREWNKVCMKAFALNFIDAKRF